ncbi:MAG: CBS domain-containing protein [Nitrospinae bacterium]|nr:CBS domain-containing protein [Nitrospinota bacterium]
MDTINEVMTEKIVSVTGDTNLVDVAKLMLGNKISSALVKEGDNFIGIITKTDLVRKSIAEGLDPKTTLAKSIMSQPLLSLDQYVSRGEANEFMLRNKTKHLAVSQGKKVIGLVTLKDMVTR